MEVYHLILKIINKQNSLFDGLLVEIISSLFLMLFGVNFFQRFLKKFPNSIYIYKAYPLFAFFVISNMFFYLDISQNFKKNYFLLKYSKLDLCQSHRKTYKIYYILCQVVKGDKKKSMVKKILQYIFLIQFITIFLIGETSAFTIEKAVSLALTNNLNLQKQQMNQKLTENDLKEKKSQNFGKIDLISSYGHYNRPRTLIPMTPSLISGGTSGVPTTKDLFITGIMYELPVFTGFAQKRSIEILALQKEITKAVTRLTREKLIYNVKTAYVNILALQAQKEAQQSYIKALQGFYNVIAQEVILGKRARVEQLKAAAEVENAKAQASRINGNIKIIKATLAALLNIDKVPILEKIAITITHHEKNDYSRKVENLEQYHVKKLDVEKNEKLVQKAKAALFPQIAFNTFYGQNFGPNDSSNPNSGDWENQEVWQTSVNVKWNIFDFGSKKSKIQKAQICKQQSLLEKRNIKLEIKKYIIKANAEIETAISRYHSAKAELIMTREMEIIEQIRFDKGAISINDLLYARARNQQALSRFIDAGYTYQNAQFYLDYLLENGENR